MDAEISDLTLEEDLKASKLPLEYTKWGKTLKAIGRGKYPYECKAKDLNPNAMIYQGDGCWSCEHSYDFINRDSEIMP